MRKKTLENLYRLLELASKNDKLEGACNPIFNFTDYGDVKIYSVFIDGIQHNICRYEDLKVENGKWFVEEGYKLYVYEKETPRIYRTGHEVTKVYNHIAETLLYFLI